MYGHSGWFNFFLYCSKKKLELINNEQPFCRPREGIVKFKMSVAMIFVNKIINKSWQMG